MTGIEWEELRVQNLISIAASTSASATVARGICADAWMDNIKDIYSKEDPPCPICWDMVREYAQQGEPKYAQRAGADHRCLKSPKLVSAT